MGAISLIPLTGIGEITESSDLNGELAGAVRDSIGAPVKGDILVITHKIISKATGNVFSVDEIEPGEDAVRIGEESGKDPRIVQAILDCSTELVSCRRGIIMAERYDGWSCANAGIDESNSGGKGRLIALPQNCDELARQISDYISEAFGTRVPVIVCDTHGRVLRNGAIGICAGSYGLTTIRRYRGQPDRNGRILQHTEEAVADEIASAATLVMGQAAEGIPAVIVRGFEYEASEDDSSELKRPADMRLYGIKESSVISRTVVAVDKNSNSK